MIRSWFAIIALVFVAGGVGTPSNRNRVPTSADITALLPPMHEKCQIKEIRKGSDGSFMVFFGDPETPLNEFEDGRIIRPPVKVVWTNEHWETRSILDHRNAGHRQKPANKTNGR